MVSDVNLHPLHPGQCDVHVSDPQQPDSFTSVGSVANNDPGLKAPSVSKFDCEKNITVLST